MTTDTGADTGADPRLDDAILATEGIDEETVEAVGKLSEAFETLEVARGHLYQFHRMSGTADFQVGEAADLLRKAGHVEFADRIEQQLVGRNILPGRWTFQMVEEYDDGYYSTFREFDREALSLTNGLRHLHEAGLKRRRRSPGEIGHADAPAPQD
ncbi:MAG: hypothetical protein NTX33_07930 [Propionibacteriales bacterium]|nr:hypothetical protein [Propionibacteriales bacterium]